MSEMNEKPQWYVIHTLTGYENMALDGLNKCIAKNNLQDKIMELTGPKKSVTEPQHKKQVNQMLQPQPKIKHFILILSKHILNQ